MCIFLRVKLEKVIYFIVVQFFNYSNNFNYDNVATIIVINYGAINGECLKCKTNILKENAICLFSVNAEMIVLLSSPTTSQ